MKTNTSGLLLEAFNHFFEKPRGKKNNYTANKDLIEKQRLTLKNPKVSSHKPTEIYGRYILMTCP